MGGVGESAKTTFLEERNPEIDKILGYSVISNPISNSQILQIPP